MLVLSPSGIELEGLRDKKDKNDAQPRAIPAANIPVSIIGGEGMLATAFVTMAAASGPRDIDLAFPINPDCFFCRGVECCSDEVWSRK